jgi:hypothetical protein
MFVLDFTRQERCLHNYCFLDERCMLQSIVVIRANPAGDSEVIYYDSSMPENEMLAKAVYTCYR